MVGKGSLSHNNRDFFAENVDQSRSSSNITYCNESLRKTYDQLFGKALEQYNARQKRADRRIENYYEHIRNGKQENLFQEVILQIGNCKDTAVGTPEGESAKEILNDYMQTFQKRNPNLRVFSAHLHMDEATPHLHIDFVPFTTGSSRGLDTRVSMKKALDAQGFKGGTREDTELNQWINSEKEVLSRVMERNGIEWEKLGTHNEHLSVLEKKKEFRIQEIQELDGKLDNLRQKKMDIDAVENIAVQKVPLSSKVILDREDYETLTTAAEKFVVQVKKESKLRTLLSRAEKKIEELQAKVGELLDTIRSLRGELNKYKDNSITDRLIHGKLESENRMLKKQNTLFRSIIEENGLAHLLRQKTRSRNGVR
ncbi:MAG: recombinase [Bacteroidia bacterium]|nr:recombinase [Bacteroidia bacterium]